MTRSLRAAGAALLALQGWACATHRPAPVVAAASMAAPIPAPAAADYRLQSGDILHVRFYYNPELDEQLPIRPDGRISLQLVGEVTAAGRTAAELTAELRRLYSGALREPELTVIVREIVGQRVYVGGEVAKPGVLRPVGKLTALQAVIEAGGFRNTAHARQVVLLRDDGRGAPQFTLLDLRAALDGRPDPANLPLQSGDIVFVPKSRIARLDEFVDKYIRQLIPASLTLGVTYFLGEGLR